MSDAPERIWVQWPHVNGAGLAFSCNARPPAKRTEYVRADRIAAMEAYAEKGWDEVMRKDLKVERLEAEVARLREALEER